MAPQAGQKREDGSTWFAALGYRTCGSPEILFCHRETVAFSGNEEQAMLRLPFGLRTREKLGDNDKCEKQVLRLREDDNSE